MDHKISGVMFYYYFICKRKLWYFSHDIQMENYNEDVLIGKHIDETTYNRKKKHIMIDDVINIDFMDDYKVIHEVKKARSIEEAALWQTKYYIWYLKSKGINDITGMLDYPKLKQRLEVVLENEDEENIRNILEEIDMIIEDKTIPPVINEKICKRCAYYELCYI
jgi:CRISPR-associated exonuclease Cas4